MENISRFDLSHYLRDLETIQQSILSRPHKIEKFDNTRKLMKHKSQFPIRTPFNENKFFKQFDNTNKKLNLDSRKSMHIEKNVQLIDLELKYLEEISQSQISKNYNSSTITKQQNQKIILEIHGFQCQDKDETIVMKRNQNKVTPKFNSNRQIKQSQQNYNQKPSKNNQEQEKNLIKQSSNESTVNLIRALKERNIIYQIIQQKSKQNKSPLHTFEDFWEQSKLLQKIVNKINLFKYKQKSNKGHQKYQ